MKIKALSLWLPWAALFPLKWFETRGWSTSYRGPLLVCAAKKGPSDAEIYGLLSQWFNQFGYPELLILRSEFKKFRGHALSMVDMTDCRSTRSVKYDPWLPKSDLAFGDFSDGRFAFRFENVRRIEPFPVRGRKGLFEVEIPKRLLKCL